MKRTGKKGFTLIELVIVIVIIGILAIIAVPIYRGYTRRAMAAEGRALVGSVASAQRIYFAEHSTSGAPYLAVANTGYNATLDVDARSNRYFTTYSVTAGANNFAVTTNGTGDAAGITVTLTQTTGAQPVITETLN